MAAPRRKHQVFISATKTDLSDARAEVTWELLKANFIPVGMENFSATHDRGWRVIERAIDDSDYYVVIVAGRYGSVDPAVNKSWTEREYDYALEKKLHVVAFIRETVDFDEADADRHRIDAFRTRLRATHLVETWTTVEDLCRKVAAALPKAVQEDAAEGIERAGWYRGPAPDLTEFAALSAENRELRERLAVSNPRSLMIERLRRLPPSTHLVIESGYFEHDYQDHTNDSLVALDSIDEATNALVVKTVMDGGVVSGRHVLPLDKLDTVFPCNPEGTAYQVRFSR